MTQSRITTAVSSLLIAAAVYAMLSLVAARASRPATLEGVTHTAGMSSAVSNQGDR